MRRPITVALLVTAAAGCSPGGVRTRHVPVYEIRRVSEKPLGAPPVQTWQRHEIGRRTVRYRATDPGGGHTETQVAEAVGAVVVGVAGAIILWPLFAGTASVAADAWKDSPSIDPDLFESGGASRAPVVGTFDGFDYDWTCTPRDSRSPLPMSCAFRATMGTGTVCGELEVRCDGVTGVRRVCASIGQRRSIQEIAWVYPRPARPETCTAIRFTQQSTCAGTVARWLDTGSADERAAIEQRTTAGCRSFMRTLDRRALCAGRVTEWRRQDHRTRPRLAHALPASCIELLERPDTPGRDALEVGIARARPAMEACATRHAVTGPLQVTIDIDGDGRATRALPERGGEPVARCLTDALQTVDFGLSRRGAHLRYRLER